jgi:peptidyl-dipeptidase A
MSRRTIITVLFAAVAAVLTIPGWAPTATVDDARSFVEQTEQELLELWIKNERAGWVQANFITEDTDIIAADAKKEMISVTMERALAATEFDGLDLPPELRRKLRLLKTSLSLVAPSDEAKQVELTRIATTIKGLYGKGEYCPDRPGAECLDLTQLSRILADSRNPDELLDAWLGWRTISPPMREGYRRFVELANEGAVELGFADLGELWRSGYDMPPEEFEAEMDRLWEQVRPLYEALHCHVRASLAERYGTELVAEGDPIPAHLLGNMWAQSWGYIFDDVGLREDASGYDLTELLQEEGLDAVEMVRYGERFFTSLGFEPLPESFWKRSLFTKPADRDVVCHASAWDIDYVDDLRIKMCIDITEEDFITIHHELGHNFYQRAYSEQAPLYRESANDGFHEGVGDVIALSMTPEYLKSVGLLDTLPPASADLGYLMRMALEKVAFLPFSMVIDKWRWGVFSGEIAPDEYNAGWWKLREEYQGVRAPVARSESDFDPGAKYHVPANTPYARYFLAQILQFQFHRALCEAAGFDGPLHRCSIYGNSKAGERLIALLRMGKSKPWPDALEAVTGQREMDATAILDYFAPLKKWLDEQNRERVCGW